MRDRGMRRGPPTLAQRDAQETERRAPAPRATPECSPRLKFLLYFSAPLPSLGRRAAPKIKRKDAAALAQAPPDILGDGARNMRVSLSANDLCVSEGFVTIAKEEPIDVMGASPLSDVIEILPARLTSLSLAAGLVGIAPPRLHDTPVEPLEREVAAARRRELRAAGEAAASQAAADADPGALRRRLQEEVAPARHKARPPRPPAPRWPAAAGPQRPGTPRGRRPACRRGRRRGRWAAERCAGVTPGGGSQGACRERRL